MPQQYYTKHKNAPLTEDEMKEKFKDIKEELEEVKEWRKETEANIDNQKVSPQKRAAAKRAMKKITRRTNTVNGQIIYWKLRLKGESHFKASIEMNEYWAECKDNDTKKEKKQKEKLEPLPNLELPNILKGKV